MTSTTPDNKQRIVALLPAFNESERISASVKAVLDSDLFDEVIVIDDGSKDNTADLAAAAGAYVVRLAFNVGKGAALEHGMKRAESADIVALLDADLASSASQVEVLLEPVLKGEADMSIATFPKASKAGFGLVKNMARKAILDYGGDFEAEAPLSGQRVLNAACLEVVRPFASGYGVETIMTIKALRAGMRVLEVPTTMSHAATGKDLQGFIHRGRQYLHVRLALLKFALTNKKVR